MSETPIFKFRLVAENTTEKGKADSANENALIAEALFKQRVESRSISAPPGSPSDGQIWIVPDASASPAPSGAWAGHEDELALYYNGWLFIAPINGPVFYVADEDLYVKYDDTASPPAWIVGGVDTFLGLSDSPASYSGQAGKAVVVNGAETGVAFEGAAAARAYQTSTQTADSTARNLSLDDANSDPDGFDTHGIVDLANDRFEMPASLDGRFGIFTMGMKLTTTLAQVFTAIQRSTDGGSTWTTVATSDAGGDTSGRMSWSTGPVKLKSGDLWRARHTWNGSGTTDVTQPWNFFALAVL